MSVRCSAFALMVVSLTSFAGEEKYGPFNLQSGRVQSNSDRGATAHRDQCYETTSDRYFKENSWRADAISQVGKNTKCAVTSVERRTFVFRNGDLEVPVELPYKFCVEAHAETGSGYGNIGKTAWSECSVSAIQLEFRK